MLAREGGIEGEVVASLGGPLRSPRPYPGQTSGSRATYYTSLLHVLRIAPESEWQEAHERQRRWISRAEALDLLRDREGLDLQAIPPDSELISIATKALTSNGSTA